MEIYKTEGSAYESKSQISPELQDCISELLERFWVLRETDKELFYKMKDNESELKRLFLDTYRFRLISNYDLIKLEKVPVIPRTWMGEKTNKLGAPVFKAPRDYHFFFLVLAFLEGKKDEQQFSLRNICEYMQIQEEGSLIWKEGAGYQNRLSLIRVMKYAEKMRLIKVIDQEIEDFSGNDSHDVLIQRTPYVSFYTGIFSEDVTEWDSLNDFMVHLEKVNEEELDRKNRYYRRLILEPVVDHHDITGSEKEYVKNYYPHVENHLYDYYDFGYERYPHTSFLVKPEKGVGEQVYPADNMISKFIMLMASHLYDQRMFYIPNIDSKLEITDVDLKNIISEVKANNKSYLTKSFVQLSLEEVQREIVHEMLKWNFIEKQEHGVWTIKEALFRFQGDVNSENMA